MIGIDDWKACYITTMVSIYTLSGDLGKFTYEELQTGMRQLVMDDIWSVNGNFNSWFRASKYAATQAGRNDYMETNFNIESDFGTQSSSEPYLGIKKY